MNIKKTEDMYRLIKDDESIKYFFGSIIDFKMSLDIEYTKLSHYLNYSGKTRQFFYRLEFVLPKRLLDYVGDFLKKVFEEDYSNDQYFFSNHLLKENITRYQLEELFAVPNLSLVIICQLDAIDSELFINSAKLKRLSQKNLV